MDCVRKSNFGKEEIHMCFQCKKIFLPGNNKTCPKCNWKFCNNGHCGCTVSKETREVLNKFYDLFCYPNGYSQETKNALFIMLNTFQNYCSRCLK